MSLRLLAETRGFGRMAYAKLLKLVSQNHPTVKCRNAKTAETCKTVSVFRRSMSYDIYIVSAF
jgi:hypothetical protein